jgi:16S rRNA (cytosine1402-N4)-methyltransferase
MEAALHAPVLLVESIEALAIRADGCYVDATFGRGGHSRAVLAELGPAGCLVVVDRDPEAIAVARRDFAADPRVRVVHGAFGDLAVLVRAALDDRAVDGVLFDLGVSSPQLDEASRGFSFLREGPLDMRMDPTSGMSAAMWLARVPEAELSRVIAEYGEERFARRVARAIVAARELAPLTTTTELAAVVAGAVPTREPGKHPATRTFQAVRMAVNGELAQIDDGLEQALALLAVGGRLAVISFHSLEDRAVKQFMRRQADGDPVWRGMPEVPEHARPVLSLVGKAIRPGAAEVSANVRSRSATLRVARKERSWPQAGRLKGAA